MTPTYYRIKTAIWSCPEFTALSLAAQHLWFLGRCRNTGAKRLHYRAAKEMSPNLTESVFLRAEAELRASAYGRVLDGRGRRAVPTPVRRAVMGRDRVCQHCGTTEDLTLDHIIPYSLGGPDTEENLQVLCRMCNIRKGTKTDRWRNA